MRELLDSVRKWVGAHRRAAVVLALAAVGVLGLAAFTLARRSEVQYFTASVEQGDIVATVQATGTINAVTTVQVGSQVSGRIHALYGDFNDRVQEGQLLAQIDPAPFQARLLQAEADLASARAGIRSLEADLLSAQANVEKMRAALRAAKLNRARTLELFEQGISSPQQRDTVEVAHETAVANLQSAEAQIHQTQARLEQARAQAKQSEARLEQARLDLQNTYIHAPIDGTVIARSVDAGQTVAASLQAPTLFTIAQDLSKMLVYAKTDESDVGRIRVGATANFKVDSFPNDTFYGRVKQVRMNAYQVENVVTYDTIVEFDNPSLRLLPGMTAYVTIPTGEARQAVKIPNGALRFKPEIPDEERRQLLARYGLLQPPGGESSGAPKPGTVEASEEKQEGGGAADADGERSQPSEEEHARRRERFRNMSPQERARMRAEWQARREAAPGGFQGPPRSGPGAEGAWQIVWKLTPEKTLRPVRVKTGLTDFTFTAMLEGDLKPGDQVIIGQTLPEGSGGLNRMRGVRRF